MTPYVDDAHYFEMIINETHSIFVKKSQVNELNGSYTGNYLDYYDYEMDIMENLGWLVTQPHEMLAIILAIIGILLNILNMLAILTAKRKLTAHLRFILSLAMSDILIGLTVGADIVNRVLNPQIYNPGQGPEDQRIASYCAFVILKVRGKFSLYFIYYFFGLDFSFI